MFPSFAKGCARSCIHFAILAITFSMPAMASIFDFLVPSQSFPESAGTPRVFVVRKGDITSQASVNYSTKDLSATNGIDYLEVSGTLTFGAGETNQSFAVPILNNGINESNRAFSILLENPLTGETVGGTIWIKDNDEPYAFGPYTSFSSLREDIGIFRIPVHRRDDGTDSQTVEFTTFQQYDSATAGLDFMAVTNTLSFTPDDRVLVGEVPIINDVIKENEYFQAHLRVPGSASGLWFSSYHLDDAQAYGFEGAGQSDHRYYTADESAGVIQLTVSRNATAVNLTYVECVSTTATAIDGKDFIGTNGWLQFGVGEFRKTIAVPILNNSVKDGDRRFSVILTNDMARQVRSEAHIQILDDDPGVSFEYASYTNSWEETSVIEVNVLRGTTPAVGLLTVQYASVDGTAIAGRDYQVTSGTLEFAKGESIKAVKVPLIEGRPSDGPKEFSLILSAITGGSGQGHAVVHLEGSHTTVAAPYDEKLTIHSEDGVQVVSWQGGGKLRFADRPEGPWRTLETAKSPYALMPSNTQQFFTTAPSRPARLYVPPGQLEAERPLVVLLHGLGQTGTWIENYLHLERIAEQHGILLCTPDGSFSSGYSRGFSWNAFYKTAADMGSGGQYVDDVQWLSDLINEITQRFDGDPRRVFLVGYDEGGSMAYRLAGERADLIAGMASIAGTRPFKYDLRTPTEPVNILHIHGTADEVMPYYTDQYYRWMLYGAGSYTEIWAHLNGASGAITDSTPSMDLDLAVPGPETFVTRYTNSPPGGAVELWTLQGSGHTPVLSTNSMNSDLSRQMIEWLLAHPKP